MQHIANLIPEDSRQLIESEQTPRLPGTDRKPSRFAFRLWERMTEIYGHRWTSSYGEEPNGAWCGIVDNLDNDQIKHGLNALLNSTDPWPPTAIQFRQMCTGYDPDAWERQCHKRIDMTAKIEDLTTKERRCRENLEMLKSIRAEVGL